METKSKKKEKVSENLKVDRNLIHCFSADLDIKVSEKSLEKYMKHFEAKTLGADSADVIMDRLTSVISSVEEEYENLTGVSSDEKIFIRNLTKLITILVSGKYNTIKKI